MSRSVHLLQLYINNKDFFEKYCDEKVYYNLLSKGKCNRSVEYFVNKFNTLNNITEKTDLYKGLTIPRYQLLVALLAQKNNFTRVNPSLSDGLYLEEVPTRFREKFKQLLVNGFWFLGRVIEDSLSEDSKVNCGNPFGFIPGDLGFWWAGVVILDWCKYTIYMNSKKNGGPGMACCVFYKFDGNRRFRYYQNSAISSMERVTQDYFSKLDDKNYSETIKMVDTKLRHFTLDPLTNTFNKLDMPVKPTHIIFDTDSSDEIEFSD